MTATYFLVVEHPLTTKVVRLCILRPVHAPRLLPWLFMPHACITPLELHHATLNWALFLHIWDIFYHEKLTKEENIEAPQHHPPLPQLASMTPGRWWWGCLTMLTCHNMMLYHT